MIREMYNSVRIYIRRILLVGEEYGGVKVSERPGSSKNIKILACTPEILDAVDAAAMRQEMLESKVA
jgi:hypothetical protein